MILTFLPEDEMILTSRKLGANKILSSEVFNKKYQKMEQPRSFDLFYKIPLNAVKLLLKFYNLYLIYNHLPVAMLEGYIKTSVKDVKGDIACSDNYHEIMISSNMFKNVEYALLNVFKN